MSSVEDFKSISFMNQESLESSLRKVTIQATGAINWRRPDLRYKNNEAFVDVIEYVNLLMSSQGNYY